MPTINGYTIKDIFDEEEGEGEEEEEEIKDIEEEEEIKEVEEENNDIIEIKDSQDFKNNNEENKQNITDSKNNILQASNVSSYSPNPSPNFNKTLNSSLDNLNNNGPNIIYNSNNISNKISSNRDINNSSRPNQTELPIINLTNPLLNIPFLSQSPIIESINTPDASLYMIESDSDIELNNDYEELEEYIIDPLPKKQCLKFKSYAEVNKRSELIESNNNIETAPSELLKFNASDIDNDLRNKLLPHQLIGIEFILGRWLQSPPKGCLLADAMGLGKTAQTLISIYVLIKKLIIINIKPKILVICPTSVILHWKDEYVKWIKDSAINVYCLNQSKNNAHFIDTWNRYGGIAICGYEMFRSLSTSNSHIINADAVILDEGHRIKSNKSAIFNCVNKIITTRRLILSGYPLQTKLSEYYHMTSWINDGSLGPYNNFKTFFWPISSLLLADTSVDEKKLGLKRLFTLQNTLKHVLLRRDSTVINKELPFKKEIVVWCKLGTEQKRVYHEFVHLLNNTQVPVKLFYVYAQLRMLVNHPDILIQSLMNKFSADDAISSDSDSASENDGEDESVSKTIENLWKATSLMQCLGSLSGKIEVMNSIITDVLANGESIVVFSRSIPTIDYICLLWDDAELDGTTSSEDRKRIVDEFNNHNKRKLFIASTQSGGEGISLIGANHCIIFDGISVSFNPCADAQASKRIYRLGQHKNCYIWRFVADQTMEEIVWNRIIHRESLMTRVVDNKSVKNKLLKSDLVNIFQNLEPKSHRLSTAKVNEQFIQDPIVKAIAFHESASKIESYDILLAEGNIEILNEMDRLDAEKEKNNYDNQVSTDVSGGNNSNGRMIARANYRNPSISIQPMKLFDFSSFREHKMFKGLKFFILKRGLDTLQFKIFVDKIIKNGGKLTDLKSCTYYLSNSIPFTIEFLESNKNNINPTIKYLDIRWLIDSLSSKSVSDVNNYNLGLSIEYIKKLNGEFKDELLLSN